MAFSFRAGTNWCHDFPKLARESGFCFNMHRTRVRVDWNRIGSIDIERAIRERDFQTVDDNVNNVIDYCLESEYDVKILDPNFVKLFRLAQLAVEYLLYCKQYLDQSVVILKDELRFKIEENVRLKEEITNFEETIKNLKEKLKDKNRTLDTKVDCHGEIHKCPHCPKTFLSASFVSAHVIRRHSNFEVPTPISPAQEEYRAETEKLHNEIKTLKERLNQTERVIRCESNKSIKNDLFNNEKSKGDGENQTSIIQDEDHKIREEINNLKTMLFTEFRNLKKKESLSQEKELIASQEGVKELIRQQEKEIQHLQNQLQEHMTANVDEVKIKLRKQEDYWKAKIDQLEGQHRKDIDNLFTQLKLTQESGYRTRCEYETKVSDLEKQSINQRKMLSLQSEQLSALTNGIESLKNKDDEKGKRKNRAAPDTESESSHYSPKEFKYPKYKQKEVNDRPKIKKNDIIAESDSCDTDSRRNIVNRKAISTKKDFVSKNTHQKSKHDKLIKPEVVEPKMLTEKIRQKKEINPPIEESDSTESTSASETSSESKGTEETEETEDTEETGETGETGETEETETEEIRETVSGSKTDDRRSSSASITHLRGDLQEEYEKKLRKLGIEPNWKGVPAEAVKQKLETIQHQRKIASKTISTCDHVKKKFLKDVSQSIFAKHKEPKVQESFKKSFKDKLSNVTNIALKAFNFQKDRDRPTPIASRSSTPLESKERFTIELLPKKVQNIKKEPRLQESQKQREEDSSVEDSSISIAPKTPLSSSSHFKTEALRSKNLRSSTESIRSRLTPRSYRSIEDFMRVIKGSPKRQPVLEMTSSKVTSTPTRNATNILQESFTFTANESNEQKHDTISSFAMSPRSNKSVLKSATGSMGSLIKKKVLFDLEENKSAEKDSTISKSLGELVPDHGTEKNEINDSDYNISSISEEKDRVLGKERALSAENITLRTSQSDKIAEISRKLEKKLSATRSKPPGGQPTFGTGFASSSFISNDRNDVMYHSSSDVASSINESPINYNRKNKTLHTRLNPQLPQPAPRAMRSKQAQNTKDFNLEADIDKLLETE